MLNSIVDQKLLINKSKQEVINMLGQPDIQGDYYNDIYFQYKTSAKDGDYLHWYLFIEIKDDTVIYTQKTLD